jgi:GMP synthase-like glutamine amidotransferase
MSRSISTSFRDEETEGNRTTPMIGDYLRGRGNVLVFQHLPEEDPGALGALLADAGLLLTAVELDHGEEIPELEAFDLMLVMGGPMDVWQEDRHPWLVTEQAAIRRWVGELGRPYLGVCLGHQLLATAMGGEVAAMDIPEIGVPAIVLTPECRTDPVFSHLPAILPGLQWHHAEIVRLPSNSVTLATNAACAVQALRVGSRAWGVQFHLEVEASTVAKWAQVPEYDEVLTHVGGGDSAWLHDAVSRHLEIMQSAAVALITRIVGVMAEVVR